MLCGKQAAPDFQGGGKEFREWVPQEKLRRQRRDSEVTQTRVPMEAPPSSKAGERKGRGG